MGGPPSSAEADPESCGVSRENKPGLNEAGDKERSLIAVQGPPACGERAVKP